MTILAQYTTLKNNWNTGISLPLSYRKSQLQQLIKLVKENEEAMKVALKTDLSKSAFESGLGEIIGVLAETQDAINSLDEWASPEFPSVSALFALDSAEIHKVPKGLVLIISPWNFPFQLLLLPLVGAIAAGCAAVLKPSEVSSACADLIAKLVPKYLDPKLYTVVTGGVPETTKLLELQFDHIFYTGSTSVGKIVHAAAAKHLTPTTLELGGKSPTIVDDSLTPAQVKTVAKRIAWGKVLNAGQVCVEPDYVLVHPSVKRALIEGLKEAFIEFFGTEAQSSPNFCRIVNEHHHRRLTGLLTKQIAQHKDSKVVYGGKYDVQDLYIEPTIIDNVKVGDLILSDEIFGPILPLVEMASVEESIKYINSRPRPLALYIFSNSKKNIDKVLTKTVSGGVTVNDVTMHVAVMQLPFGGIGPSGMGAYHGKRTFDVFTHEKSVLRRPLGLEFLNKVRYPPYSDSNLTVMKWALLSSPTGVVSKVWAAIKKRHGLLAWVVVGLLLWKRQSS